MVANVAHVIIPAQRRALAALAEGRELDRQRLGEAARRSRHNALLALPTVLLMLGGHAPLAAMGRAAVARPRPLAESLALSP